MKLRQFLLFGGEEYSAEGGWNDFIGSFASDAEARAHLCQMVATWTQWQAGPKPNDWEDKVSMVEIVWWQIVDSKTSTVVSKSDVDPYQRIHRPFFADVSTYKA